MPRPRPGTGQQIAVTWTVTNDGTAPAAGTWQDCVYLSDDDQVGGDTPLGCEDRLSELSPGGLYQGSATVAIPGRRGGVITASSFRSTTAIDVWESDEGNNDAIVCPITISRPNLTISDTLDPMPTEGWTGRPMTVGWAVTNTGNSAAEGTWDDCVYLSDDDVIGDDIPLDPPCLSKPCKSRRRRLVSPRRDVHGSQCLRGRLLDRHQGR